MFAMGSTIRAFTFILIVTSHSPRIKSREQVTGLQGDTHAMSRK
jgi:hypothetical protein